MYLLDVRDYTYVELFKKLKPNYPEEICYKVLNRLCEIGCINDRRYAEKYARYLCEVKKFGFFRAREEMKKRGLPQQLISEYLEPFEETEVCEILVRPWKVVPGRLRPNDRMAAHTAFLVFTRIQERSSDWDALIPLGTRERKQEAARQARLAEARGEECDYEV